MSRARVLNKIYRAVEQQAGLTRFELRGMGRRDFLKGAGLAFALPQLGRAAGNTPRVAIVGGGISGLMAALTLHEAGIASTVYESSGRVGGRMFSNASYFQNGQSAEWCGELIDTSHVVIRSLAKRFGLTLDDANAAMPPGSESTNYVFGEYYTDAQITEDIKPIMPLILAQRKAVGDHFRYNNYNQAALKLDQTSMYDWVKTYVPGGQSSKLGFILDLSMVALYGLPSEQCSSLNFILFFASDERFHIREGNDQVPKGVLGLLPAGTVLTGHRLTRIVANANKTVTLGVANASGAFEAEYDHVILTLPFSVLRGLDIAQAGFDSLKLKAIKELGYGTNSKLITQFATRFWNAPGPWPGVSNGFISTDLPVQTTWDTSRGQPGVTGVITDYTGGAQGASFQPEKPYTTSSSSSVAAAYAQTYISQLNQVWPGAAGNYNGLAMLSYPTGDPNLLGSYSAWATGQFTGFSGYEPVAQGQIHFGGEHTSMDFQGYMEGGAREGIRAAKEVLVALG